MNTVKQNYFLATINQLRVHEEILLFTKIMEIALEEENLVMDLLEIEYHNECLDYPYIPPPYDAKAALWAAKTIYFASQLLLYRENKEMDIASILPNYTEEITPSAILSADLCLRFLPHILANANAIDVEDILIDLLEKYLQIWHYSGIGCALKSEALSFDIIFSDKCLNQLYINRIITHKAKTLAELPFLKEQVKASMGNFTTYFWKDL